MDSTARTIYRGVIQRSFYPNLRRTLVLAITWSDAADEKTWRAAPFRDGTEWIGLALAQKLASLTALDTIILQHWPTLSMLRRLHAITPAQVLIWCQVECIQSDPWPAPTPLHQDLIDLRLRGTDGNLVNVYEGQGRPASWAIDMLDPRLPDRVASSISEWFLLAGPDSPSGIFIDSMTNRSFWGTAKNQPPAQDNRNAIWSWLLKLLRQSPTVAARKIWGNVYTLGGAKVLDLDVDFIESFDASLVAEIEEITSGVCLNDRYTKPGHWKYVAHQVAMSGAPGVSVCTAWTGAQLFEPEWGWQE